MVANGGMYVLACWDGREGSNVCMCIYGGQVRGTGEGDRWGTSGGQVGDRWGTSGGQVRGTGEGDRWGTSGGQVGNR